MTLREFLNSKQPYDKIYYKGDKISKAEMYQFMDNKIDIETYYDYDGCNYDGCDIMLEIVIVYILEEKVNEKS